MCVCVCVCCSYYGYESFILVYTHTLVCLPSLQLSVFLHSMSQEGIVEVKETSKGVDSITDMNTKHPMYVLDLYVLLCVLTITKCIVVVIQYYNYTVYTCTYICMMLCRSTWQYVHVSFCTMVTCTWIKCTVIICTWTICTETI